MSQGDTQQETTSSGLERLKQWLGAGLRLRGLWRTLRLVLGLVLLLVMLVAGTILVGIATRGGREFLLDLALRSNDGAMPGTLSVADARWPRLGRIDLTGVLWSSEGDTLATADRIVLEFSTVALRRREIHIHALTVDRLTVDLPEIRAAQPVNNFVAEIQESDAMLPHAIARALPFFHAGAVGGLPSAALDSLHLQNLNFEIGAGAPLRLLDLRGSLNLRAGEEPRAELALRARPRPDLECCWRLAGRGTGTIVLTLYPLHILAVGDNAEHDGRQEAAGIVGIRPPGTLSIDVQVLADLLADRCSWPELTLRDLQITGAVGEYRLSADLGSGGRAHTDLRATWPAAPAFLPEILLTAVDSVSRERFQTILAAAWSSGGPIGAEIQADLEGLVGGGFRPDKLDLRADLHLPGPAQLAPLLPPELELAGLDGLEGRLLASADLSGPEIAYELGLDLGATGWLDRAHLDVKGLGASVQIEALEVTMAGSEVDLRGSLGDEGLDLDGRVLLPDGRLPARWRDYPFGDHEPYFLLDARLRAPWPLPDLRQDFGKVRLEVNSLALRLAGADADLHGILADGTVDADARLRLPNSDLLALWPGELPEDLDLQLDLDLRAVGAMPYPVGEIALRGAVATGDLRIPELEFQATHRQRTLELQMTAPAGLDYQGRELEALQAHFHGELSDSLDQVAGAFRVAAAVAEGRALLAGELATGATISVAVDSLHGTFRGLSLAARERFEIAFDTRAQCLELRGLDLAGTAGSLRGGGFLQPDSLSFDLDFDLQAAATDLGALLSPQGDQRLPEGTVRLAGDLQLSGSVLQPSVVGSVEGEITSPDPAGTVGSLSGSGFLDSDSLSIGLDFDLQAAAADLNTVLLPDGDRRLPEGTVRLAGDLQLGGSVPQPSVVGSVEGEIASLDPAGTLGNLHGSGFLDPDSLSFGLDFDLEAAAADLNALLLPEGDRRLPEGRVRLAGDLQLGGSAPQPTAAGSVEGEIVSVDLLEEIGAQVEWDFGPRSGLQAQWQIVQRDTTWVEGQVQLPLHFGLQPVAWHLDVDEELAFSLETREIALRRLESLWPPGIRAEGRLGCEMTVAGRGRDAAVSGQIRLDQARIRLPDGSWFTTEGQVGLAGTVADPRADGRLNLRGGLIRVPDLPPSLLPTDGSSLLWEHPAPGDAVVVLHSSGALPTGPAAEPQPGSALFLPDLRIALHSPGNVWLRGHGLNVELGGDLSTTVRNGIPRLDGQLRAVRGSLNFMGRLFSVDRGLITFYADEAYIDPQLDIVLSVSVNGIVYRVEVAGRSQNPELILSSEPPVPAGDIISGLLFGRPMSDLDSGQAEMMEARSREILASYGSAVLGTQMARQLGVDVITIKHGEGAGDASRLMVGKYLSPRVMVSYKQVLSSRSAFYVSLSYLLRSYLKVMTTASQSAESGIELMLWKEY